MMTKTATLPNGVRVLVGRQPQAATASVGVFVRWGSAHESARLAGIGHVLEHMAFKGTRGLSARQLNGAAERLGAEVNAHTDKDHTAFYMRGLPQDMPQLLALLAEIVLHPSLPADELERERQVLLQEFAEDEDDPVASAFKLFDKASFGDHPLARPVIGTRRNIERFTRADLLAHRAAGYVPGHLLVAVHGPVDPQAVFKQAQRLFGALPSLPLGRARVESDSALVGQAPTFQGGLLTHADRGVQQAHVALGWAIPALAADDATATMAAAVLAEGMSSPLLERVREQRALAYHLGASADVLDGCGQFVIEASTAPEHLELLLQEVQAVLEALATRLPAHDWQRAQRQQEVRALRESEQPLRWMEQGALEWFAHGHVRSGAQRLEHLLAVPRATVRKQFAAWLQVPWALGVAGAVPRGARARLTEWVTG
jgi:predicted Zn-dependent peptidase